VTDIFVPQGPVLWGYKNIIYAVTTVHYQHKTVKAVKSGTE